MKKKDKLTKTIRTLLQNIKFDQYFTKSHFDYIIVALSLLLGFHLGWDILNILFFSFVIWIILNPISSKLLGKGALILLMFIPLLTIINKEDKAQQFAILAYYFLIITVIMSIVEYKKGKVKS